jgi:hypothetical protein
MSCFIGIIHVLLPAGINFHDLRISLPAILN